METRVSALERQHWGLIRGHNTWEVHIEAEIYVNLGVVVCVVGRKRSAT